MVALARIPAPASSVRSTRSEPYILAQDALLLARAIGGDRTCFGELVRRHQGRVRALLRRLTRDATLADDLAQDTFLRAYRALPRFRRDAQFSTWLHRIAYNVFLNHRTRSRAPDPLPDRFDASAPGDACTAHFDTRMDVEAVLGRLPEHYRLVLASHYLEGLSYPETSAMLKIPLGTIKTQIHRAKRMLYRELAGS